MLTNSIRHSSGNRCSNKYHAEIIATLVVPRNYVEPTHTVEKVGKLFIANPNLQSVPVVYNKIPVGIVHRYQLMDIFLSTYGRDLYGKKPISRFMDTNPLIIEENLPVELASQHITRRMEYPVAQDFIITNNGEYKGVGTVLDLLKKVTDLKIREYNHALDLKVKQLEQRTAELIVEQMKAESASEQAKVANRAKSRFLANMSHELRTPINAMMGYAELLVEEAEAAECEKCSACAQDLEKITRAGKHLLGLVSDILDITKIEAGKLAIHLETFEIAKLIQEVAITMQPLMQARGNVLRVEHGDLGYMHADALKVRQCLFNLLSNANKFSEQSEIKCFAERQLTRDEKEEICLKVHDHGIGMSWEQIDKLFQPFTQVDNSSTRRQDGAGLGLVITKHFCEVMGGNISVESELGNGSIFTIRLPTPVPKIQKV
jgi:signal transduction histidine kinase